jgi:hypothetical protein
MKKTLILFIAILTLAACQDKIHNKYIGCFPVYTDYETFRSSTQFIAPQPIKNNGNIYIKDQYLFIVSPDQGIHFLDNSNPSSPVNLGFLKIMGCTGMAIKGNYLYANSFIDLVVFDLTNVVSPVEISRVKDVFPQAVPLLEKNYPIAESIDKSKGVVTAWEYRKVKEKTSGEPNWINCINCDVMLVSSFESQNVSSGSTGISGSITKLTIINDFLYVMDYGQLKPFNISNPNSLVSHQAVDTWREVETLFPYNNYIFMGTTTGMLIYNTTNPAAPEYVSSVNHLTACDPVVVQDNYCYVTVRSGTRCGSDLNQLDIIDISNIENPILMNSFNMENPHGLGIDGNQLFICDGAAGLKIFDASQPVSAGEKLLHHFKDIQATDVIPFNNLAIVIGENGIRQYDYSDPSDLKLLSTFNF